MNDRDKIALLYDEMYTAMIQKDRGELERLHDDSFTLTHMTGMVQDKETYVNSILNGTLNYYTAETEALTITVEGDTARMTGKSRVSAAVFGGGRHTWPLRLDFTGKQVFPVMTHEGSGQAQSARALKEHCKGAQVGEGLAIQGGSCARSEKLVADWAKRNLA